MKYNSIFESMIDNISEKYNVSDKAGFDVAPGDVVKVDMRPSVKNILDIWKSVKTLKLKDIEIDELGKVSINQSNISSRQSEQGSKPIVSSSGKDVVLSFLKELKKKGSLEQILTLDSKQINKLVNVIGTLVNNIVNNKETVNEEEFSIINETLDLFELTKSKHTGKSLEQLQSELEAINTTLKTEDPTSPKYIEAKKLRSSLLSAISLRKSNAPFGKKKVNPPKYNSNYSYNPTGDVAAKAEPAVDIPKSDISPEVPEMSPEIIPSSKPEVKQTNVEDSTIDDIIKNNTPVPDKYRPVIDKIKGIKDKLLSYREINDSKFNIIDQPFRAVVMSQEGKNRDLKVKILVPTGRSETGTQYDDKSGPEIVVPFNSVVSVLPAEKSKSILGKLGSWLSK
jgi:hypothetical protein